MRTYHCEVSGRFSRRDKRILSNCGLKPDGYKYIGDVNEINRLKRYCKRRGLHLQYATDFSERSYNYRTKFIEEGPTFGNGWLCAYCGKKLTEKTLTVDHLIPVAKARDSVFTEWYMKKHGYNSINDQRNLVAACENCNKKKGKKTGLWVLRGRIGRRTGVRLFFNIARIAVPLILIGVLCFIFRDVRI